MFTIISILMAVVFGVVVVAMMVRAAGAQPPSPGSSLPPANLAPLDDDAFRARVMDEIDAGRKIEAIKLVRERTGLGLAEAKALVDALAAGDESVEITGVRDVDPGTDVAKVALDDPDLAAQLVVEIAAGRRIEAIKLLRERTGLGLKEAKDAIESLERDA